MTAVVIVLTVISTVLLIGFIGATYLANTYKKKCWNYLKRIDNLLEAYRQLVHQSIELSDRLDELTKQEQPEEEQKEEDVTDNN